MKYVLIGLIAMRHRIVLRLFQAIVLVSAVAMSACQHTLDTQSGSLELAKTEQRQELFRNCFMNLMDRYQSNVFVDNARLHSLCSDFAKSRVPR
jgi:hypothetical protein